MSSPFDPRSPISLDQLVQGYYFRKKWEGTLPRTQANAMMFVRAYQNYRPQQLRFDCPEAQAYSNWRTAWLTICCNELPPFQYQGVGHDEKLVRPTDEHDAARKGYSPETWKDPRHENK